MNSIEFISPGTYITRGYGIWRHDKALCNPGKYRLVCRPETLALLDFQNLPIWQANRDCVVNDYGDLVAVPA